MKSRACSTVLLRPRPRLSDSVTNAVPCAFPFKILLVLGCLHVHPQRCVPPFSTHCLCTHAHTGKVELENVNKDAEVRRLQASVADLEAEGVALKRVNERLEAQARGDEEARKDLVQQNASLEAKMNALSEAQKQSEQRVLELAKDYERLEAEHAALRRREAALQTELRRSTDDLAHKAEETTSMTSERMVLLSEKRQLEDSLRNVLSINDQLLQKVYDSSVDALGLGQASWAQDSGILVGGALKASTGRSRSGDEERAARLHDASLGKGRRRSKSSSSCERRAAQAGGPGRGYAASTVAYRSHTKQPQMKRGERDQEVSSAAWLPSSGARRGQRQASSASRTRVAEAEWVGVGGRSGNRVRPVSARGQSSLMVGDGGSRGAALARSVTDFVAEAPAWQGAHMSDIKTLEGEVMEEVRVLRRQYKEICLQVLWSLCVSAGAGHVDLSSHVSGRSGTFRACMLQRALVGHEACMLHCALVGLVISLDLSAMMLVVANTVTDRRT